MTRFIWIYTVCKSIYLGLQDWKVVQILSTLVTSKELSEILRDIRTSTYQIYRIEEKIDRTTTFHKRICNLTPEVCDIHFSDILKISRKRGEIAPQEQFSPLFQNILLPLLVTLPCWKQLRTTFHFEISGYSREAKSRYRESTVHALCNR